MSPVQPNLFEDAPASPQLPPGAVYRRDFITAAEEAELIGHLEALPFQPFRFQGFEGRRRVVSFGWRYDFEAGGLQPAEPFPDWLLPLKARAASFAGVAEADIAHALLLEYTPGAGIGWHRDRPPFDQVIGVSLLAPCRFRFRQRDGQRWTRTDFTAEPRSAYLLRGPARSLWEHSIPPMEALRYSITFRTVPPGRSGEFRPPAARSADP